jgi:hypothetical protein
MMYAKGADSVMLERMAKENKRDVVEATRKHLEEFSSAGLRTLVLAYRPMDQGTYDAWSKRYEQAALSISNRKDQMEARAPQRLTARTRAPRLTARAGGRERNRARLDHSRRHRHRGRAAGRRGGHAQQASRCGVCACACPRVCRLQPRAVQH